MEHNPNTLNPEGNKDRTQDFVRASERRWLKEGGTLGIGFAAMTVLATALASKEAVGARSASDSESLMRTPLTAPQLEPIRAPMQRIEDLLKGDPEFQRRLDELIKKSLEPLTEPEEKKEGEK